jgi:RNA polymerase sigma-70 factor (ECF subfamily)
MYSIVEAGTMYDLSSQQFDSYSEWSDEDLLLEYRLTSRRELFEELVQRYERSLFAYLCRYIGNAEDAEEVFQSAFMKVHLKIEQFEEGRKFRPWLYRIATNIAIDRMRRSQRLPKINNESDFESNTEDPFSFTQLLSGNEPLPYDCADTKEQMERLHQAIAELPQQLRAVLNMVYFQGFSYRETAEILNIPFGTVKTRLSNAFKKLNLALK